jgi:hypothetical protein
MHDIKTSTPPLFSICIKAIFCRIRTMELKVNAKCLYDVCRLELPQPTGEITQEIYWYLRLLAAFKLVNRAACNLHMQIGIMVNRGQ